jgi:cytochrome c-type biogenesis protein CcmH/NrfF
LPERRRALAGLLASLFLVGAAWAAGEIPAGVPRQDYLEVATTILCDCGCHPQSVHECACGRAAEMREEIAAAINTGGPGGTPQTGTAVIAAYVERHGEKIRIAPTFRGFNLVAWLGPSIGLLAAAIAIALVLRRWRAGAVPALPAPAGAPLPGADDPYLKRLARELEEER